MATTWSSLWNAITQKIIKFLLLWDVGKGRRERKLLSHIHIYISTKHSKLQWKCTLNFSIEWKYAFSISLLSSSSVGCCLLREWNEWVSEWEHNNKWVRERKQDDECSFEIKLVLPCSLGKCFLFIFHASFRQFHVF